MALLADVAAFVIEITIIAVRHALTPIRLLVSARFRETARQRWRENPGLRRRGVVFVRVAVT
jgi:hypothetical protein